MSVVLHWVLLVGPNLPSNVLQFLTDSYKIRNVCSPKLSNMAAIRIFGKFYIHSEFHKNRSKIAGIGGVGFLMISQLYYKYFWDIYLILLSLAGLSI